MYIFMLPYPKTKKEVLVTESKFSICDNVFANLIHWRKRLKLFDFWPKKIDTIQLTYALF